MARISRELISEYRSRHIQGSQQQVRLGQFGNGPYSFDDDTRANSHLRDLRESSFNRQFGDVHIGPMSKSSIGSFEEMESSLRGAQSLAELQNTYDRVQNTDLVANEKVKQIAAEKAAKEKVQRAKDVDAAIRGRRDLPEQGVPIGNRVGSLNYGRPPASGHTSAPQIGRFGGRDIDD